MVGEKGGGWARVGAVRGACWEGGMGRVKVVGDIKGRGVRMGRAEEVGGARLGREGGKKGRFAHPLILLKYRLY